MSPLRPRTTAAILLKFAGGERGALTVSQIAAGRKNCIRFEIAGTKNRWRGTVDRRTELWIGDRAAPNALLMTDPSLMHEEVRPFANYPGGHQEGFPDTFKQLFARSIRTCRRGDPRRRRCTPRSKMDIAKSSFAKPS